MAPVSSASERPSASSTLERVLSSRGFRVAAWSLAGVLCVLKFCYLSADFPNESPWLIDQAKFTDEGWWGNAAVRHFLTGHWYLAGDYNPAVALPVWPALLSLVFQFTGVSVVAARALNVSISVATLAVVYRLVQRCRPSTSNAPALVAVLLLAASPFAFAFNRLAVLDSLIVLELCAALLLASLATADRAWPLVAIMLLIAAMILTKTTAALLAPAILWMAWASSGYRWRNFFRIALVCGVLPAALCRGYAAIVAKLGYGPDYAYFFGVNAMPDIDWAHTLPTLHDLFINCFWIDRVLFPVGLCVFAVSLWRRSLWRNPLFASSWIALAAQAVFIFSRQDDFAPRYFLVMLPPLVFVAVLTLAELLTEPQPRPFARAGSIAMLAAMGAALILNVAMIGHILTHRDYDYRDAAVSIRQIVRSHPEQKALLLGVSADQMALMTGIPAINDGFGTEEMSVKVERYHPGWYLAWNDLTPEDQEYLKTYRLEKMESYEVFDDETRTTLTLYSLVKQSGSAALPASPSQ